jgi:cytochrome b involved in lipid metabolism
MQKIIITVIVIVAVIGGVFYMKNKSSSTPQTSIPNESINTASTTQATSTNQNNSTASTTTNTTNTTASTTVKTYKISDIAMHKDSKDCWTTIGGEVFDLTAWIKQHPGGDKAILSICGIDGTKAFEGQHGGKAKIEMKLETFKIGNLSK